MKSRPSTSRVQLQPTTKFCGGNVEQIVLMGGTAELPLHVLKLLALFVLRERFLRCKECPDELRVEALMVPSLSLCELFGV